MTITLGIDSLCWHMPLESGRITFEAMLEDCASLGAPVVALNLHHTRTRSVADHGTLAQVAADLGIRLLAQGDFVGSPRLGDDPSVGVERIEGWLERAVAVGSPTLRLASGFYRAELAGQPDKIEAEREYVTQVLLRATPIAAAGRRPTRDGEPLRLPRIGVRGDRARGRRRPRGDLARSDQSDHDVRRPVPGDLDVGAARGERSHPRLRADLDPAARPLPPPRVRGAIPLSGRRRRPLGRVDRRALDARWAIDRTTC